MHLDELRCTGGGGYRRIGLQIEKENLLHDNMTWGKVWSSTC